MTAPMSDDAYLRARLAAAEAGVALVVADLYRTTDWRPQIVVDIYDECAVRIRVDDGFETPSCHHDDRIALLAEVGSYIQDQLDSRGCWPVCAEHDAGLHAEVRDGAAVWRCWRGKHTVAAIGELPSSAR
jgi:hypothetical protein